MSTTHESGPTKRNLEADRIEEPSYERRLVLFLDFLGFREHVKRTTKDIRFLSKIIRAINTVSELGNDDRDFYKSQRITQFSDCIVLSYRIDEEAAVFWMLFDIAVCILDIVGQGFLLRGAVTVGNLIHTRDYLIGPAIIEAYELESRVAKYPRVLIDKKVIKVARQAPRKGHTDVEEEKYVRAFMTKDKDKLHYFDYVSWKSVVGVIGGVDDKYPAYLKKIGEITCDGLKANDPGIAEKYLWLHRQYLSAIRLVESLPPNNKYRIQSLQNCEAIESLPKFQDEARAARRRLSNGKRRQLRKSRS